MRKYQFSCGKLKVKYSKNHNTYDKNPLEKHSFFLWHIWLCHRQVHFHAPSLSGFQPMVLAVPMSCFHCDVVVIPSQNFLRDFLKEKYKYYFTYKIHFPSYRCGKLKEIILPKVLSSECKTLWYLRLPGRLKT